MSRPLSVQAKYIRAALGIPGKTLRVHLSRAKLKGRCWVCNRGLARPTVNGACPGHFRPGWSVPGPAWGILKCLKGGKLMSWEKSKDHSASRGSFFNLRGDGDRAKFAVLTEPVPTVVGSAQYGERTVYRVEVVRMPVKASSPVQHMDMSLYDFEAYSSQVGPGHEGKSVIEKVRHGKPKDPNTRYTYKVTGKAKPSDRKLLKSIAADIDVPF